MKEKLLAAHRAGIARVLLPLENEKDLEEVPANILGKLQITFVDHMDQVLAHALYLAAGGAGDACLYPARSAAHGR